jgi:4-amino-4-deoxy-L-arabinose transferase-like glycosyltransferase
VSERAEPRREQKPRRHLLALLLLFVWGVLAWTSERRFTLTADEPLHLVRGHAWWWTHESKLNYAHPPLANILGALPQAGGGDEPWGLGKTPDGQPRTQKTRRAPDPKSTRAEAMTSLPGWAVAQPLDVSTFYFRHDFLAAKAELTAARRMMMLWTLALGLFLYAWCERRWGFRTAIAVLGLYCLHPALLAHGTLATTDMPLAVTAFLSLAALIAWIERPGWLPVLGFWLASTAMVLSKHSGLACVVVMSLMLLGAAAVGYGGFAEQSGGRVRRVVIAAGQLSLVAAAMILTIDAIYLFDRVGLTVAEILAEPEPHNWISKKHDYEMLEQSVLAKLPADLPLPFPYTWLVGLATVSEQNAMGHGNYFFGLRGHSGHPLYFPVLLFAKSPTGLLLLLGVGLWPAIRRLRAKQIPSVATTVLMVFAIITLLSACMSDINIGGVRHVLPIVLIMIVFAGRVAAMLLESAAELPRALHGLRGRILVGACMLGCALGVAWTYPRWLGDFNLLVGGQAGGHRISVIGEDWGQDLGDLADLAHARGWSALAYHTTFPLRDEELESRGLEVHDLDCKEAYAGPAPVVIHLSDWVRRPACFEWLGERTPAHVVNHHLLVFE